MRVSSSEWIAFLCHRAPPGPVALALAWHCVYRQCTAPLAPLGPNDTQWHWHWLVSPPLAVALAAQDTLANLLGSFVIYLDKPFKAGDLIEADGITGRIEHVGFRTTRIRTLEKSLITVPNKKLIDTALNNITLSDMRRVRFNIALTYNSKPEQITGIIDEIKSIIDSHPKTGDEFVVRFVDFDSSSLNILVIYFVKSNEFEVMVDVKEQINLSIMKIIEKHGCAFAFPTQTIHLQQ